MQGEHDGSMISSVCVCIYCTTKMTEMVPSHGEAGGRGKKDARFTQACESLSYCVLGVCCGWGLESWGVL